MPGELRYIDEESIERGPKPECVNLHQFSFHEVIDKIESLADGLVEVDLPHVKEFVAVLRQADGLLMMYADGFDVSELQKAIARRMYRVYGNDAKDEYDVGFEYGVDISDITPV